MQFPCKPWSINLNKATLVTTVVLSWSNTLNAIMRPPTQEHRTGVWSWYFTFHSTASWVGSWMKDFLDPSLMLAATSVAGPRQPRPNLSTHLPKHKWITHSYKSNSTTSTKLDKMEAALSQSNMIIQQDCTKESTSPICTRSKSYPKGCPICIQPVS